MRPLTFCRGDIIQRERRERPRRSTSCHLRCVAAFFSCVLEHLRPVSLDLRGPTVIFVSQVLRQHPPLFAGMSADASSVMETPGDGDTDEGGGAAAVLNCPALDGNFIRIPVIPKSLWWSRMCGAASSAEAPRHPNSHRLTTRTCLCARFV